MQQFLRRYRYDICIFIVIACAVSASFGQSLFQPFAPIDDYHLIVHNLAVRTVSFSSIQWFFTHFDPELYIPVTFLSFQLEHFVAGLQPWLFHFDNLLLHSLNAFLVYCLMKRVQGSMLIALCCALIFTVHPITTETVVWISGRKDLLATCFGLSSLFLSIRSIERNSVWMYIASVAFFLLALLSKVSVAPLALLLPFFLSGTIQLKERFKISAPFLVIATILGIVAIVGKESVVGSTLILDRVLLSAAAVTKIFSHIVFPVNLSVYYALPSPIVSLLSIASVIVICFMVGVAWFFRNRNFMITLGLGWFLLCVALPVLNVSTDFHASGTTFASDRYAYLPLVGILLSLSSIAAWCIERFDVSARNFFIAATAITCSMFVFASRKQTLVWNFAHTLYSHALEAEPTSVHARVALATLLSEHESEGQAFEVLKEGLKFSNDAKLRLAAATLYAKVGQVNDAEENFEMVRTMEPATAEPWYGLGVLTYYEGNTEAAEQLFRSALEKEPRYTRARMALADLLLKKGDSKTAEEELRKAVVFDEWNAELLQKLSEILAINGNEKDSKQLQEKADLLKGDLP